MKEEIKQECDRLAVQYIEAAKKYHELISQVVSTGEVEPGKPIQPPKRVLDSAALKEMEEAGEEFKEAHQKFHECLKRLAEADY